ncbi:MULTISPECIES: DUF3223 domain-containing protein [unclassified Kitasatospora]|uniref:DUF3223 domain-containing protein n=1 Tax=unclassified Kitasatospora TaxID=2633591 RepID=UPI000709E38A|nr:MULTISPECIES: DUF3223 domain-containing protein [unclassified Kitasatospora]KQV13471.1 hypothetical protein ASC99_33805 [Kitasatospora sp. Root107]KRB69791.1 hypothetical protein ASE03_26560 [Kitasatospora sp. Root187]
MPAYWLGEREFRTKGDAEREVSDLLKRYDFNVVVTREEDDQLLRDALDKHPKVGEKVGPGIEYFRIIRTPLGNHKGPLAVWVNGDSAPFSYKDCFKAPSHRQQVVDSMRYEVQPQVNAYFESRSATDTLRSDESGIPLTPDNVNVAYFQGPRFIDLANAFAEAAGGWEVFELATTTERGLARFVDRDLAGRWHAHHQEHAVLGLLSKPENRQRPRF